MTLTVGTDAYETLANVRAYWDARDATASAAWVALSDAEAEQLIRKATDYIDRKWSYIGEKATATGRSTTSRTRARSARSRSHEARSTRTAKTSRL